MILQGPTKFAYLPDYTADGFLGSFLFGAVVKKLSRALLYMTFAESIVLLFILFLIHFFSDLCLIIELLSYTLFLYF